MIWWERVSRDSWDQIESLEGQVSSSFKLYKLLWMIEGQACRMRRLGRCHCLSYQWVMGTKGFSKRRRTLQGKVLNAVLVLMLKQKSNTAQQEESSKDQQFKPRGSSSKIKITKHNQIRTLSTEIFHRKIRCPLKIAYKLFKSSITRTSNPETSQQPSPEEEKSLHRPKSTTLPSKAPYKTSKASFSQTANQDHLKPKPTS